MKRFVIISLSLLLCLFSYAGKKKPSVFYSYRALKADGCDVVYTPVWSGDSSFLSVSVLTTTGLKFVTTPVLLLKTAKDEVIKIEGVSLGMNDSQSMVLVGGGIGVPITTYSASANFPMTKEQVAKLKDGIVKVRINTVPYAHEREFKKDKIGRELYRIFREAKWDQEDF